MKKSIKRCPVCMELYLWAKRTGNWAGHLVIRYIHVDHNLDDSRRDNYDFCERDTATGQAKEGLSVREIIKPR